MRQVRTPRACGAIIYSCAHDRVFCRCEEWFFADKVGLTPEAFDLLGQGDKKWYCPKCKEKKAKKKAKKRQRERGGSPEAKQPRPKIKMGGK